MATAALNGPGQSWNADGSPRIVGDIIAVDADDVDATGRLRPIDLNWATALGQIMLAEGQRTPIEVSRNAKGKPWRLVAGGHRHAAAQMFLDLNPLKAIEVPGSELARRRAEVSENLWRRELDPLDRATFIAELHELLRTEAGVMDLSPQQLAINARWQKELRKAASDTCDTMSHVYGFTSAIAEQIGLAKRTIERDLFLARRLSPAVAKRLRGHPIARNPGQLRALARLEADQQQGVADLLLECGKTVPDALAIIAHRVRPTAEDRLLSAFIGSFQRMSLSQRRGALKQLASMLPAPFKLVEE
jgi:hypothetical protein